VAIPCHGLLWYDLFVFNLHLPKIFKLFIFQISWLWAYLMNVYYIGCLSLFLLPLCRYLCWWIITPQGYHLPSSQCFATDMSCSIRYIYHWNVQFLHIVIITSGIDNKSWIWLRCLDPLVCLLPKPFKLFG
jgi:hypothetical protein